jgi:hypothetical protein
MDFPFLHTEVDIIIGQYQGKLLADTVHFNGILRHGTIPQKMGFRCQVSVFSIRHGGVSARSILTPDT